MKKLAEFLKPFKKPLIIITALLVLYIVVGVIVPQINEAQSSKSPIVSITATNNNEYKKTDKIENSDFTVKAKHENGKYTKISKDDFKISRNKVFPVGKTTSVEVTLKDDVNIKCTVKVKNERNKIVGFQCGYPNVKDVKAVLYSNGELCFEGKGDVLIADDNNYQWFDYEEEDDYPINAVSFEKNVTPTNLNQYFSGLETLTYVSKIPSSVKNMVGTFADCTTLKEAADISECNNLTNTTESYSGCEELKKAGAIPENVVITDNMFSDCIKLQGAADCSKAVKVQKATGMYSGCSTLTSANVPPNVQNLDNTFENCINLKEMPMIPKSVTSMNSTFANNKSLEKLSNVPRNVTSISGCFSGCEMAAGSLVIDTDTKEYSEVFSGAALATNLNLTGQSSMLNYYASTSENRLILINGKKCTIKEDDSYYN